MQSYCIILKNTGKTPDDPMLIEEDSETSEADTSSNNILDDIEELYQETISIFGMTSDHKAETLYNFLESSTNEQALEQRIKNQLNSLATDLEETAELRLKLVKLTGNEEISWAEKMDGFSLTVQLKCHLIDAMICFIRREFAEAESGFLATYNYLQQGNGTNDQCLFPGTLLGIIQAQIGMHAEAANTFATIANTCSNFKLKAQLLHARSENITEFFREKKESSAMDFFEPNPNSPSSLSSPSM